MDEKVYKLKCPVTVGEHTCAELKLRRPKTKDFIAVGNAPLETAESIALLLASVSGEPYSVISQLDIDDLAVLRLEAVRIFYSYLYATPYELNPTQPPEAEAKAKKARTENV